jgi:hypothetical protein
MSIPQTDPGLIRRSVRTGELIEDNKPPVPEFASYPPLRTFFRGVPGITYLYALVTNTGKFHRQGWEVTSPSAMFSVKGVDFIVLAKGKRIPGVSIESMVPPLLLDTNADTLFAPPKPATEVPDAPQPSVEAAHPQPVLALPVQAKERKPPVG